MRLEELRVDTADGWRRAAATVIWEETDRPRERLWFECPTDVGPEIAPDPHAFLLGAVMPALDHGERRIRVEGAVCPELRNGLHVAFRVIAGWFPEVRPPLLEPTRGFHAAAGPGRERVASFLSGGVDALATLRANRLDFPLAHPASIRDGFILFGFNTNDFHEGAPAPDRLAAFHRYVQALSGLAREAQVTLVPVRTNVRFLARDFQAWNERGMGAGLAAVAHAFGGRVSRALIASSGVGGGAADPLGTHPLLDPNYSRAGLDIRHDRVGWTRIEKTALLADWDAALAVLDCCQRHQLPPDGRNCGRCNKCVRTMVQLAAVGALERARTFPAVAVTADTIRAMPLRHDRDADFVAQCVPSFERAGRADLAAAIHERLARYARQQAWLADRGWRGAIRRWDRRVTGGWLTRAVRRRRG